MRKKIVGVIGAGECDETTYEVARQTGELIAASGYLLVCGGLGGVMEGAARGAQKLGGETIGILPGAAKTDANPYISIPIVTGLGHSRNILVVQSSDCIVAISGGFGTLSEIAVALKLKKTVIGLHTWKHIDGVAHTASPSEAIHLVKKTLSVSREYSKK
ncbi:MAG: TIGR00725 family protein [Nitrospinota bacterium]